MATEKILNTRIQLKYDTWSNWSNDAVAGKGANLILKKGELGICEIPASTNANQSTSEPVVLFKVGTYDGVNDNTKKAFKDLPWISALAADVYSWAKKPTLDANDLPTIPAVKLPAIPGDKLGINISVDGNGNAVTGASWDPTTKTLTLTKGETFLKASEFHDTTYSAGTKLDLDGTTFNHETTTRTDTSDTSSAEFGKTIDVIDSVTSDETGHITAVNKKTITLPTPEEVSLPTVDDTEVAGQVVVEVDQNAGEIDVKRKAIEINHEDGQIYLTIGGNKIGTGFSDADFIKDGFLSKVDKDINTNEIVFTWNTDAGSTETRIDIDELVEVYEGDNETIQKDGFTFSIKDGGIKNVHIATDAAIAKNKLASDVQASLALADSALQSHQDISGKADKVASATEGNFAGLDATGNLTDSGKKASDFATAAQGEKADTAVQSIVESFGIQIADMEPGKNIFSIAIKQHGVSAEHLKSERGYSGEDAEIWVFDCGDSTNV